MKYQREGVVLLMISSVILALGADFIKVDTSTRQFIDATGCYVTVNWTTLYISSLNQTTGRARLYHGVNVVSLMRHYNMSRTLTKNCNLGLQISSFPPNKWKLWPSLLLESARCCFSRREWIHCSETLCCLARGRSQQRKLQLNVLECRFILGDLASEYSNQ